MEARTAARLVLSDPRTARELARVVGRSEAWVRHVRTGRLYQDLPRPRPTPWKRDLTPDEVWAVCLDPRAAPDVAKELGVGVSAVQMARSGQTHQGVPRPPRMPEWPRGHHGHRAQRPPAPRWVRSFYTGQGA